MKHLAREIGILGAFITCMYFGFAYNSSWPFLGAFIAFTCLGKTHKDN